MSFGIFLLISVIILAILIYMSNNWLKVYRYNIRSEKIPLEFNKFKIIHLSDLHSKIYKDNNKDLFKKIDKEEPDIIVMTGDMISRRDLQIDRFISSLEYLIKKYPVYYCIGNHERRLGYKNYKEYIRKIESLGVIVLTNKNISINKVNSKINIYGVNFNDAVRYQKKDVFKTERSFKWLSIKVGNIDLNYYNILLCHDALNFELYERLGVDLIFSGHVHGGLVRFGKIGLFSVRRTLFPKYVSGVYKINNSKMIVSAGMGPAKFNIRLFNRPQIISTTLYSIQNMSKKVEN